MEAAAIQAQPAWRRLGDDGGRTPKLSGLLSASAGEEPCVTVARVAGMEAFEAHGGVSLRLRGIRPEFWT